MPVICALEANLSAEILKNAAFKQAFDAVKTTQSEIQARWPNLHIGIDVVELRSYHYHTGLMYAVCMRQIVQHHWHRVAVDDGIGEHFGRARPATGF